LNEAIEKLQMSTAAQASLSILVPCRNEQGNVAVLAEAVAKAMAAEAQLEWRLLFIDNASADGTADELRRLSAGNRRIGAILNQRNFGHVRSPYHGLLQAPGDAVIVMAADMQDPPELIPEFLQKWREGYRVVLGQKLNSEESWLFFNLRRGYYKLVKRLADVDLVENATGFGLYDRTVIEQLRALDEPYPYVRGLVCELGYPIARVPYEQPQRKRGSAKNNFYTLYDVAMLGITSHSKVPLRLATMLGFAASALSFAVGVAYLAYKLIFWDRFAVGVAPVSDRSIFLRVGAALFHRDFGRVSRRNPHQGGEASAGGGAGADQLGTEKDGRRFGFIVGTCIFRDRCGLCES